MTYKVIRAKKEFFDRNPSGRILNRFSSDIGTIDTTLIECAYNCLDYYSNSMIILVIIASISYSLIIACIIVVVVFGKVGLYF